MSEQFLTTHNPEYIEYISKKRKALIGHTNDNDTKSSDDVKPVVSKHYYNDVFVKEFNLHFGYPQTHVIHTIAWT